MFFSKSKKNTAGGLVLELFINKWRIKNERKTLAVNNNVDKKPQSRWVLFTNLLKPFWLR
jgi:hypothetical protein